MQLSNTISIIAMTVGFFVSGAMAQNGERTCILGGISCEYPKGRCARLCNAQLVCDCPDGQDDNPYTGASCITAAQALGRQSCSS